jgi:hypothetical protein
MSTRRENIRKNNNLQGALRVAIIAFTVFDAICGISVYGADESTSFISSTEREIGEKLAIEVEILELLKHELVPVFGIVKIGGLELKPDQSFIRLDGFEKELLPSDRIQYQKIVAAFPPLKPAVESFAIAGDLRVEDGQPQTTTELGNRPTDRVQAAIYKYFPLGLQSQAETGNPEIHYLAGPLKPVSLDKRAEARSDDDLIRRLEEKYKGIELKPEYGAKQCLALRFYGAPDSKHFGNLQLMILTQKLNRFGYDITPMKTFEISKFFSAEEDVEKFLQVHNIAPNSVTIKKQTKQEFLAIYPVDWKHDLESLDEAKTIAQENRWAVMDLHGSSIEIASGLRDKVKKLHEVDYPMQYLELSPGASVQMISPRHWRITVPERWIAILSLHTAIVTKQTSSKHSACTGTE